MTNQKDDENDKHLPSLIRTAHGSNRAALLVVERPPLDELPPPNAERTGHGLRRLEAAGRPFEPGNSAAAGRKPKLARVSSARPEEHPRWSVFRKQAARYSKTRVRELKTAMGGRLGSGPCAMLASAALALAGSRCLYELGAETLDAGLFKAAAALADSARQCELTAVGLAEREAAGRVEDDDDRLRREKREARRPPTPPQPGAGKLLGEK